MNKPLKPKKTGRPALPPDIRWPCTLRKRGKRTVLAHDLSQLAPKQAAPVIAFLRDRHPEDEYTDPWARDLGAAFEHARARKAGAGPRSAPLAIRLSIADMGRLKRFGGGRLDAGLIRLVTLQAHEPATLTELAQARRAPGKLRPASIYIPLAVKDELQRIGGNGHGAITAAVRVLIHRALLRPGNMPASQSGLASAGD